MKVYLILPKYGSDGGRALIDAENRHCDVSAEGGGGVEGR